jgi:hypothetical protein
MTLIILQEAEEEFNESALHYESKEPGLGTRFRDEVATAMEWIIRKRALQPAKHAKRR